MTGRDWLIQKLKEFNGVISLEPIETDYIRIHYKDSNSGKEYPPFITAVISAKLVNLEILEPLFGQQDFQFVCNIPKDSVWTGAAISLLSNNNIGWGGVGDLMSAMGGGDVQGFQKKEYVFVERGLNQHTRVSSIIRHYDRLIEIQRYGASPIVAVLLNEYEITAEHVRNAREIYGNFSLILKTNPNGNTTQAAEAVAKELNAEIFKWGPFLGRLNKK